MKPEIFVVNAMTYQGRNGNPAGVVLDAGALSAQERQRIATEANFSETAFLEKTADGRYALAFYTPTRAIEYCGHATIATFGLLRLKALESRDVVEVVISGTVLRIQYDAEMIFMEQKPPKYEALLEHEQAAALNAIGASADQLDPAFTPQIVDTGNRFILIGLRSKSDVAGLTVQHDQIAALSRQHNLVGFYVFVRTLGEHAASARMFAPLYGIAEESATGMAAGPLAAALVDVMKSPESEIRLLQGEFMTPPCTSEIIARIDIANATVRGLKVGGRAAVMDRLTAG